MTETFSGKIAFVTSTDAGMGLAPAHTFARAGASVVLADVNADAANEAARSLIPERATALAVRCDVAVEHDVATAIQINAVCPGVIQTPMLDGLNDGDKAAKAELIKAQPIRHLGSPEEIADAVLWLCSSRASLMLGQTLFVDGGYSAQ